MSERLSPEREAEIRHGIAEGFLFGLRGYQARDLLAELDAVRAEKKELQAALIENEDVANRGLESRGEPLTPALIVIRGRARAALEKTRC